MQALRTRIETLITALSDPVWRERNALAGLAWYVALWTLYAAFAKGGQDIHFDMGEVIAMSREPLIGTVKHPPLDAWIAGLWFAAFPLADWAYYLLAMISATVGLWVSWRLSARFLDAEKRVVGLALMTLVPFFNFHALKFNANSVLIPVWALTTWWFLRSYETGSLIYATLAGLAAAGAMYGKYWSIFLIAGLVIAALADSRRRSYFTSAAPWVTVAAGAVAFAPHVIWLVDNDFPPLRYALASHALASEWQVLRAAAGFLGGAVGYLALPIVLVVIAVRPNRATLADIGWPSEPQRRLAMVAFILPIILPVFAALAAHAQVVSLWTMCGATLLPVVLLSSPLVRLPHVAAVRIVTLAVIFPIAMLIASPAIGYLLFRYSPPDNATYSRPLADAIGRAWYDTTARPLLRIGSNTNLVNGVVFYLPSRPATYDVEAPEQTPWTTVADIRRDGIALFCKTDDAVCNGAVDKLTEAAGVPAARVAHAMLSRSYWGYRGPFAQFRIVVVLPQK